MAKLTTYRVDNPTEEVACEYCGEPLYVGERVTLNETTNRVFCSRSCNDRSELFNGADNSPIADAMFVNQETLPDGTAPIRLSRSIRVF